MSLDRRTELKPGKPLERKAPLRARSPRKAADAQRERQRIERTAAAVLGVARYTGPSRKVRDQVKDRDGACLSCGQPRRVLLRYNHRSGGMGGNRAQAVQDGTTACDSCNSEYENRPLWAYAGGWKLPIGADPLEQPVRDHAGNWWLLDADGGRTLVVAP
jgi:hypothetical protein